MIVKGDVKVRDLLPLGSVVILKNSKNIRIMITEYFVKKDPSRVIKDNTNDTCDIFDYMGINWYENNNGQRMNILFNHEDIEYILFRGYINEESIELMKKVEKCIEENGQEVNDGKTT